MKEKGRHAAFAAVTAPFMEREEKGLGNERDKNTG